MLQVIFFRHRIRPGFQFRQRPIRRATELRNGAAHLREVIEEAIVWRNHRMSCAAVLLALNKTGAQRSDGTVIGKGILQHAIRAKVADVK